MHKYAAQRLQLSVVARADAVKSVVGAFQKTLPDIRDFAEKFPYFRETAKRMLDEWEKGLSGILPKATAKIPPPGEIRKAFGMSEAEPTKNARNEYVNKDVRSRTKPGDVFEESPGSTVTSSSR